MENISSKHAVEEIRDNIEKRDMIKAKLVLACFDQLSVSGQAKIIAELEKGDAAFVVPLLIELIEQQEKIEEQYPLLAQAILEKAIEKPAVVTAGLKAFSGHSFYIQLAGDLQLQETVPELIKIILSSEDPTVILAGITALGAIGDSSGVKALTEFLYSGEASFVQAAISALGKIGSPDALERLAAYLGGGHETDKLILDAFALHQEEFAIEKLCEALKSQFAQVRNHARKRLTEIGAKALPSLISNLSTAMPDFVILSLNVIHEIGDKSAAMAVRQLINSRPQNANVRFAAYEVMAALSDRRGDYILAVGLEDNDENVRMAAARAVDCQLDDILAAGVRNIIAKAYDGGFRIIRATINSKSARLLDCLLEDKDLKVMALDYLSTSAHQQIRDFFVKMFIKNDKAELANELLRRVKKQKKKQKGIVCAVDDSKMVLNIYRSMLTELGYDVVLFQYPHKALEWLQGNKPDFVCTDLNMPDITGVELVKKIRTQYSKNELPVIMVTTQSEGQDNKAAWEAGVSEIMPKPFDALMLRESFLKITDGFVDGLK